MARKELFKRNVPGVTEILQRATVGIAGCGGLGSNAAVALVRAGIGTLILADFDLVEESNLNRQYYFQSDIGKNKTEALAAHCRAINPDVGCVTIQERLGPSNVAGLFAQADLLIEAFDRAESKAWLIEAWRTAFPDRPVICASGLSGIGNTANMVIRKMGRLYMVGDGESDMSIGLCAARVGLAANMQANIAIELLAEAGRSKPGEYQ